MTRDDETLVLGIAGIAAQGATKAWDALPRESKRDDAVMACSGGDVDGRTVLALVLMLPGRSSQLSALQGLRDRLTAKIQAMTLGMN